MFNQFTGPLQHDWKPEDYRVFLLTASDMDQLRNLARRHPVTIIDPWAEGEAGTPTLLSVPGPVVSLRIPIGPVPRATDKVSFGAGTQTGAQPGVISFNKIDVRYSGRDGDLHRYDVRLSAVREAYNLVQIERAPNEELTWVEVRVTPRHE